MHGIVSGREAIPACDTRDNVCGSHAIYLMLRLHGINTSHDVLARYAPTHADGMTLEEVTQALRAEGLPAELRLVNAADLHQMLARPVLAYVRFSEVQSGHLYVLTRPRGNRIEAVDATTGRIVLTSVEKLDAMWEGQGYVIAATSFACREHTAVAFFSVATVAGFVALLAIHRRRRVSRVGRPGVVCVVALGCLGASYDASGEPPSPPVGNVWRSPDRGAMNALFLQLRSSGWEGTYRDYDAVVRADACQTFADLCRIAGELGHPMTVTRLSGHDLARHFLPVTVLLEPDGIGTGTFVVLAQFDRESVTVIEGGAMRWIVLKQEDFRRSWTGHALVPVHTRSSGYRYGSDALWVALAACGSYGIAWGGTRLCRRTRSDPKRRALPVTRKEQP